MSRIIRLILLSAAVFISGVVQSRSEDTQDIVYRRANFSNEFNISSAEAINARGTAKVKSSGSNHHVKIQVNGLQPGLTYVILNHWFEPISERGVPDLAGAKVDPSCNGHFQFLGGLVTADKKGKINVKVVVDQLAPHIWVANLKKFMEVTQGGTQAPASADSFSSGGLLIPYDDIIEREMDFEDTDPLTQCD